MSHGLRTAPKNVTPIELFFDLVFVFAFIQVTSLIVEHSSVAGLAQGVIVLGLLWWAWAGYAWLTNAIDTTAVAARLVLLAAMAAMLITAAAVPAAFGENALMFAIAYVVVRALHLALYAVTGQRAIVRLAPGFVIACGLLLVGALFSGWLQALFWLAAIAADYGFPLIRGGKGLTVQPEHWAERHGLVVILALGETVIASGLGVLSAREHLTLHLVGSILVAMAVIAGFWWMYFYKESERTHAALQRASGIVRTHLARDVYSYMHLALVGGIVVCAASLETALHHPFQTLHGIYPFLLGGGIALFFSGLFAINWRRGGATRLAYLVAACVSILIAAAAYYVPAIGVLGLLAILFLATAAAENRFSSSVAK